MGAGHRCRDRGLRTDRARFLFWRLLWACPADRWDRHLGVGGPGGAVDAAPAPFLHGRPGSAVGAGPARRLDGPVDRLGAAGGAGPSARGGPAGGPPPARPPPPPALPRFFLRRHAPPARGGPPPLARASGG